MEKQNKSILFPQHYRADIARQNNVIGTKLSEARKLAGLKQSDLSERLTQFGIDVTPQNLSKWEKGNVMPNAYQLLAVSYALGISNPLEYFTGSTPAVAQELNKKGLAVLQEFKEFLVSTGRYEIHQDTQEIRMIPFPVGDLPLSAGTGTYIDESKFETMDFPENLIPEDADFALRVSGDSMEPAYHDGQYVFIEKCEEVSPGSVGAFVLGDQAYIKVYGEKEPDDDLKEEYTDSCGFLHPQKVLISYNKNYNPIIVDPDTVFFVVGRVLN
ncbi:MAG: LexA family transcriptional regulator [Blautia sp.]|nr:LexA family transcriptional regulator [Blautia sp.]